MAHFKKKDCRFEVLLNDRQLIDLQVVYLSICDIHCIPLCSHTKSGSSHIS